MTFAKRVEHCFPRPLARGHQSRATDHGVQVPRSCRGAREDEGGIAAEEVAEHGLLEAGGLRGLSQEGVDPAHLVLDRAHVGRPGRREQVPEQHFLKDFTVLLVTEGQTVRLGFALAS